MFTIETTATWVSPYTDLVYGTAHTITVKTHLPCWPMTVKQVPSLNIVLCFKTLIDNGDYLLFYEGANVFVFLFASMLV